MGLGPQLVTLAPALAFLLAGVPLAALLDRLGFFDAVADEVSRRSRGEVRVVWLWVLAAATTVVLNLDTTVVLLTPLYVRIAQRSDADPVRLALIPLVLASLASSVLPVSNLTTLVMVDRLGASTWDVVANLAVPSAVAVAVGWWAYRRTGPSVLSSPPSSQRDPQALRVGGAVVGSLLVAFVIGPAVGIRPWMSATVADVVLVAIVRHVPWRDVPVATALGVAAVGALVGAVVPATIAAPLTASSSAGAAAGSTVVAAGLAGVVNNLPALFVGLRGTARAGRGLWAWVWGVNAGAALTPVGALANLLWLRVLRDEGLDVGWRRYVRLVTPVALPAVVAGSLALVLLTPLM